MTVFVCPVVDWSIEMHSQLKRRAQLAVIDVCGVYGVHGIVCLPQSLLCYI